MGAFGVVLSILHFVGLYVQLSAASNPGGDVDVDNHISGNALFTEVPHDVVTESGQDVEMACSFRGAGSPSVSLEIQWWYIRDHREWSEKTSWTNNQVVPMEEMVKDATKISVVKVAGSNISHKLRLSNVKLSDEGTYECRVIDFSDSHVKHHRVRAYLQVQPPGERKAHGAPHDKQHLQHEGDHHQPHQEDQHPHPHPHLHPGNQQPQHPGTHQGDHQPHKENHRAHSGEQKPHNHGGDHLHQEDQRLHVAAGNSGNGGSSSSHHKKQQEEESRKRPAHNHQSEGREMKRRSLEGDSDCTTDGCGH